MSPLVRQRAWRRCSQQSLGIKSPSSNASTPSINCVEAVTRYLEVLFISLLVLNTLPWTVLPCGRCGCFVYLGHILSTVSELSIAPERWYLACSRSTDNFFPRRRVWYFQRNDRSLLAVPSTKASAAPDIYLLQWWISLSSYACLLSYFCFA